MYLERFYCYLWNYHPTMPKRDKFHWIKSETLFQKVKLLCIYPLLGLLLHSLFPWVKQAEVLWPLCKKVLVMETRQHKYVSQSTLLLLLDDHAPDSSTSRYHPSYKSTLLPTRSTPLSINVPNDLILKQELCWTFSHLSQLT